MAKLPEKIIRLAEIIRENGGRAMLVGGCVRDELMNVEPKDWDVEVYNIEPPRLREILDSFGRVDAVGEAFTVYKIGQDLDVALPRRERKVGRGHKGFVVEGDKDMTFAEGAKSSTFTAGEKILKTKFCAWCQKKLLRKILCACCVQRSSPRGSSSISMPKPSKSAAESI
jgi:hypothetical protein